MGVVPVDAAGLVSVLEGGGWEKPKAGPCEGVMENDGGDTDEM